MRNVLSLTAFENCERQTRAKQNKLRDSKLRSFEATKVTTWRVARSAAANQHGAKRGPADEQVETAEVLTPQRKKRNKGMKSRTSLDAWGNPNAEGGLPSEGNQLRTCESLGSDEG